MRILQMPKKKKKIRESIIKKNENFQDKMQITAQLVGLLQWKRNSQGFQQHI